jgi:hypothetical protein
MYEEKLDVLERKREGGRLFELVQTEVYRKDLRPWVMHRMQVARMMLYNPESSDDRIQAVAILGVLENLLTFTEGKEWEERWALKPPEDARYNQEMPKEGLLSRVKKSFRKKQLSISTE